MTEREIFVAAIQCDDAEQRASLLERECGGDAGMRARVDKLLAAYARAGDFLEGVPRAATAEFSPLPNGATGFRVDEDLIGQRVGPYRVVQKLGEGGMGSVWLAEQTEPVRRMVALKVIKAGMDTSMVIARFEAERQALALMDHSNIAKILDAGATAAGRPFFVMELVKGISITKYCDQEHLTPAERLDLFIPVCQAVQHAHQKGVIHRDLKPSNIIVGLYDGRPVPKIIDFGVAKATGPALTERTMFTEIGSIIGTLEYMAPEQAERNNLDIDTRADIYSLGVILYELLAGEPPFGSKQLRGAALSEMLRLIREVEPAKPSTKLSSSDELPSIAANRKSEPKRLARWMHGDLDWIVMKCLEKDRGRRYETANGLALELQRFLAHEPVLAGPPSASYRIKKFLLRHKSGVVAASLLLLFLVLGICGTTWGLLRARAERDAKELARAEAENRRVDAENQRQRADQQAAIAGAVNDFLCNDLLKLSDSHAQADRGFPEDPNLTVKTALQRASDRIGDQFSKDPEVESALRSTIGIALRSVGEAKQAIPHLERASKLRQERLGDAHSDTLKARQHLAVALMDAGRLQESIAILENVTRQATEKLGANHPDVLTADDFLAQAYRAAGRFKESIVLSESVVERTSAALGPDHRFTLTALNNLGMEYSLAGRGSDAVRVLSQLVEKRKVKPGPTHLDTLISTHNLARAHLIAGQVAEGVRLHELVTDSLNAKLGPDHPHTLISRNGLAWAYQSAGQLRRAVEIFESVRELQTNKLGPDHFDTLVTSHNIAGIYRELGRIEEGLKLQEHVRDRLMATVGADHPNTIIALSQLGRAYQQADRLEEAIQTLRRVVEIQETKRGATDDDTLVALHNLAVAYRATGKLNDAVAIHLRVRDAYASKNASGHPNAMITLNNLALAYIDQGRHDEAIAIYEKLAQAQTEKLGANHPDPLISNHNLALAYIKAKRFDEAIKRLEEILPRFRTTYQPDHLYALTCCSTLGEAYVKAGRFEAAEKLMREAIVLRSKALGNHWSTANARALLGESLTGLKRFEVAEPMLLQAHRDLKQSSGNPPNAAQAQRLKETAQRLVSLYEAWEKPEQVEKWRKEASAP